jgi:hypothetical protein
MELERPLLGIINETVASTASVRKKWIAKVTAEQVATWFQYEREASKKSAPFRTLSTSLIKIDPKIQRGDDNRGYHGQVPTKIAEIKSLLLQDSQASVPRIYCGTLVWNIRPPATFLVATQQIEHQPPRHRLIVETSAIYLTDSAHRHFGIAEAVRAYKADPTSAASQYPKFSPSFEFSVEIYNLGFQEERELFAELNGKQKKISATKRQELDVSSPVGALKDAILALDLRRTRLLENNIEVASNQNRHHTLMTMNVFVTSIAELFDKADIERARDDEDVRDEMADYYCSFLEQLTTLRVSSESAPGMPPIDCAPFRNLYQEIIKPAEELFDAENPAASEDRLELARSKARDENARLRKVDLANNNGTIKALFRLGRLVRRMPNWKAVIHRLQNDLIVPSGGRFFQAHNTDLLDSGIGGGVPIAYMTQDGGINLQVQSKNITSLYNYLRSKLGLAREPELQIQVDDAWHRLSDGFRVHLLPDARRILTIRAFCVAPLGLEQTSEVGLAIESNWRAVGGRRKLALTKQDWDRSYQDPHYSDIGRRVSSFALELPSGSDLDDDSARLKLTLSFPGLSDEPSKATFEFVAVR